MECTTIAGRARYKRRGNETFHVITKQSRFSLAALFAQNVYFALMKATLTELRRDTAKLVRPVIHGGRKLAAPVSFTHETKTDRLLSMIRGNNLRQQRLQSR